LLAIMDTNIVYGRKAIQELLATHPDRVRGIFVARGAGGPAIRELTAAARATDIPIRYVPRTVLDRKTGGAAHQGVVAERQAIATRDLSDVLDALDMNELPMLVACDGVTDPHNVGAILRSAAGAGVSGVILPAHDSPALNATVEKASAGALQRLPIARVSKLAQALGDCKTAGLRVLGTDADGDVSLYDADLVKPFVLVVGSEGKGIRKGVRERCDTLVRIPLHASTESLNVSVAAAIVLFEAVRQRRAAYGDGR